MNAKNEFVLQRIFDGVFFIADKEQFDEENKTWKELPMIVHGFLVVKANGLVTCAGISNDVKPELNNLIEKARKIALANKARDI